MEMEVTPDAACIGAVAAAAEAFASRAGMQLGPRAALVAATEEACKSTFKLMRKEHGPMRVRFAGFDDRVEIEIEHHGEAVPSVGLDTFAGFGAQGGSGEMTGIVLMSLVDRVQYETVGGRQRMTLVKHVQPPEKDA
jgi:anti-sigma regulatory factor (Ser/Thr protein kinase)